MANKKKKTEVVAGTAATEEEKKVLETVNSTPENNETQTEDVSAAPKMTEEQIEYARIQTRKAFNEQFSKWAEIDNNEWADDDFIASAKKDFEDALEQNKKAKFCLGKAEDGNAVRTAEFLKDWGENFITWEKGMWRGVITFNKIITKLLNELNDKKSDVKDFEVDYSTLWFLYQTMMHPEGKGLESARLMAKMENYDEETDSPCEEDAPVTYSGILEKVKMNIDMLQANEKKLTILKERMNLAYAGLKMNLKISEIEEFIEFHNAITASHNNHSED